MKTIVCFGDSNTHGYEPGTGRRYPFDTRWPGVLQSQLGQRARVVEEGLNGRTTVYDEPARPGRNGAEFLPIVLETHEPVDVLIMMLGTNDILRFSWVNAEDAARGINQLVDIARIACARCELRQPDILIVSPPLALPLNTGERVGCQGDSARSAQFAHSYRTIAENLGCAFFDAATVSAPSSLDQVHLDAENHRKLGEALTIKVGSML